MTGRKWEKRTGEKNEEQMALSKRRKVDSESRAFNAEWTDSFPFIRALLSTLLGLHWLFRIVWDCWNEKRKLHFSELKHFIWAANRSLAVNATRCSFYPQTGSEHVFIPAGWLSLVAGMFLFLAAWKTIPGFKNDTPKYCRVCVLLSTLLQCVAAVCWILIAFSHSICSLLKIFF